MQIIIDIPQELYEDIKEHGLCGYCSDREFVGEAISKGIPLKEGHWIKQTENVNRCSECGRMVLKTSNDNYCPNCGSAMKGENE